MPLTIGSIKDKKLRSPDYYTKTVLGALIGILMDQTLSPFHKAAMQAVMSICANLGAKCAPFLDIIIPNFLALFTSVDSLNHKKYIFTQIGKIVQITRRAMAPYLTPLIELVMAVWDDKELLPYLVCVRVHITQSPSASPNAPYPALSHSSLAARPALPTRLAPREGVRCQS